MGLRRPAWLVVLAIATGACGSTSDDTLLPDPEAWEAEHPQPADGVPLHLVVIFTVEDPFQEHVVVTLDGSPVVAGDGPDHDSDEHCAWGGPYSLMLEPGAHEIEAVTAAGETLTARFDLESESTGTIHYRHPDAINHPGEPPELAHPELRWELGEGLRRCL